MTMQQLYARSLPSRAQLLALTLDVSRACAPPPADVVQRVQAATLYACPVCLERTSSPVCCDGCWDLLRGEV